MLKELQCSALQQGFSILSNGYGRSGSKRPYQQIVCKHGCMYRNNVLERESSSNTYLVTSSQNDKKNSRGSKGRSMNRRSITK